MASWGNSPIIDGIGTIVDVVVDNLNETPFDQRDFYVATSSGDIWHLQPQSKKKEKIHISSVGVASKIAYYNNLFAILDGGTIDGPAAGWSWIYSWGGTWTAYSAPAAHNPHGTDPPPTIMSNGTVLYFIGGKAIWQFGSTQQVDFGVIVTWDVIGTPGKQFAVGFSDLYGVSGGDELFKYQGGQNWNLIRGETSGVVAGRSNVFAIDKSSQDIFGQIFEPFPPPGHFGWVKIGGPGIAFTVNSNGQLFGLAADGVHFFDPKAAGANKWSKVGGPAGQIFGRGQFLFATSTDNQALWAFR
jgi:hypothetical protein